jgi:Ferroportin1 (FPN1)
MASHLQKTSLKGNILQPNRPPTPVQNTRIFLLAHRRAASTITNALPYSRTRLNATANAGSGSNTINQGRLPRGGVPTQRRHHHYNHYLYNPSATGNTRPVILPASISQPGRGRTPIHPEAMNALYFMYLCACLVERTWRFALPLCLAYVEGGYQAIAVLGFVSPLGCSLLGPATGRLLDGMYRPYGLSLMVALQGIAIMASGLVVLAAAANPTVKFVDGPLFIILLLLSMIERLTAILSELAIERDWVTQLSGKENALALASSNAMLRRTDLSCELVGSLAFGWLYSTAGLAISVASATFLALVLLPAQLLSIFRIARMVPEAMVHGREEAEVAMFKPPSWKRLLLGKKKDELADNLLENEENNNFKSQIASTPPKVPLLQRIKKQSMHAVDGWREYFRQPILFSSLTFVLLFFNVALSPGGLITAFLTAKGLDGKGMAIFRGGCAGTHLSLLV